MSEELKPCPFCGGKAERVTKPMGLVSLPAYHCENESCPNNAVIANISYEAAAIEWNTRPVEDALRALVLKQEDQLNRILQPGERWLELRAAAREAFDDNNADGWLIQHGAELGLSEARVVEAIRETLKEMVKR